jgi:hypothetical protein
VEGQRRPPLPRFFHAAHVLLPSGPGPLPREEVSAMADQYKCAKCGHTSSTPGTCCGEPMKKAS